MSLKILTILCLCAPSLAFAEWRYEAHYGPAGRALGFGDGGQTMMVDCGNGGFPAVTLIGPRPVGGVSEDYVFSVDRGADMLIGAACGADGCFLMFESGEQMRGFLGGVKRGTSMSVAIRLNSIKI